MKKPLSRALVFVGLLTALLSSCNEDTLDPTFYGSLDGTVTLASSGLPAGGVEVSTVPATSTVVTDEQGYFLFPDIPTGEYSVVAALEGYKNATRKVGVARDKTTTTTLALEPDATAPKGPGLPTPSNGADNIVREVTLKWSVEEINDDALTFDVVVFESNVPAPIVEVKDHNDTTLDVSGLKFNTTYYWQVTAKNSAGIATHGPLWHFTTVPFPDNRYVFSTHRDGNYEIYSSDETGNNLVRLTYSDKEQVYPQFSNDRRFIAYAEFSDLAYHLYVMNSDGSAPARVTTLPLAGYHNDGRGFCWSPDNGKLLYSHYDKLYSVDRDGSNLTLIATAPAGRHFRACDWTDIGNRIIVETVGVLPYETEIRLIDLAQDTDDEILADEPGTIQSPSFSIDGKKILFTHDISGFESTTGRQLDSRPCSYDLDTGTRTDLSKDKPAGTNDFHPRYSPDGARIIFENMSNDGSGVPSVFIFDIAKGERKKLFDNARMPDWQ